MEMSDFAVMKELIENNHKECGMSDYEEAILAHKASGRANGSTVAAITLGSVGLAAGIGAWIFGGVYSAGRANANTAMIVQQANHTQQIENLLGGQIAANRTTFENAKSAQDNINLTVTQSGTQNTSVSQSALAQAEATLLTGAITGQYSHNPTEVVLTSKQYCPCPNSCG